MIRPCPCGSTPAVKESERSGIYIMRMECKCGKRGATLMFTKREQAEKMRQAAIDGWNLADSR